MTTTIINQYTDDLLDRALQSADQYVGKIHGNPRDGFELFVSIYDPVSGQLQWRRHYNRWEGMLEDVRKLFLVRYALEALGYDDIAAADASKLVVQDHPKLDAKKALRKVLEG
jgi:hypothetical protein